MELEMIVALVAEEVRRILAERAAPRRRLLVVLTGAPGCLDAIVAALDEIGASQRFSPTLLLSRTASRRADRHRLERALGSGPAVEEEGAPSPTALAWDADLVLVPWLSLNSAAKLATGVCDTLPTSVLMLALLRGIPVVGCADELDPDRPYLASWARPATALASRLRSYLGTLRSFGMQLVGHENLAAALFAAARPGAGTPAVPPAPVAPDLGAPAVGTGRRPVITAADVQAAAATGDLGQLPADGIWTPLAQEALRRVRHGLGLY